MRAARIDANQPEIVAALRKAGCTVQHLHSVGRGCPDLLVGRAGVNYLLEIKDGGKAASDQKLTPDQVVWHRDWGGSVAVVDGVVGALKAVGLIADER